MTLSQDIRKKAEDKKLHFSLLDPDKQKPEIAGSIAKTAEEDPSLFRDVRLLNIEMPFGYIKMGENRRAVHQSRVITMAILARLIEKDKTPVMLEGLLKSMLEDHIDKSEIDKFIEKLSTPEDENVDSERIKERLNYFLGKIVKLSEFIGKQINFLKEFWTAA